MTSEDYVIVESPNPECLADLQSWLSSELKTNTIVRLEETASSLDGENSAISVFLGFIKSNYEKIKKIIKNWITNYNKDIELTFEHGDKKAIIKCPASRVQDSQIAEIFSEIDNFFSKDTNIDPT